jgi:hypothetical protein
MSNCYSQACTATATLQAATAAKLAAANGEAAAMRFRQQRQQQQLCQQQHLNLADRYYLIYHAMEYSPVFAFKEIEISQEP